MVEIIDRLRKELMTELTTLEKKIRYMTALNKNDYALELENIMIPIFNICFDGDFKNANTIEANMKGIDLIDIEKKIGIQISMDGSAEKVKNTIKMTEELYEEKLVNNVYLFVLSTKGYYKKEQYNCKWFKGENIITITEIVQVDNVKKLEQILIALKELSMSKFDPTYSKYINIIQDNFVETKFYLKLKKKLRTNRAAIVVGNAGVGKTLNCYKIFDEYISEGYVPISPDDFKVEIFKGTKRIMFVDDFISNTSKESINHDKVRIIFDILSSIESHENLVVLLNSRNKILKDFKINEDRVEISMFNKYMIDHKDYSETEKLMLLKSYLSNNFTTTEVLELFSKTIGRDYCDTLVQHNNFNPRLIENFCNTKTKLCDSNIGIELIKSFDNPDFIYKSTFRNLSKIQKVIMKLIWLNDGNVEKEIVVDRVQSLFTLDSEDIDEEISILVNTLVLVSTELSGVDFKLMVYSPGVLDYMNKRYKNDNSIKKLASYELNRKEVVKLVSHDKIDQPTKEKLISENIDKLVYKDKIDFLEYTTSSQLKNSILFDMEKKGVYTDDIFKTYSEEESLVLSEGKVIEYFGYYGLSKLARLKLNDGLIETLNNVLSGLEKHLKNKISDYIYYDLDEYKSYLVDEVEFSINVDYIKEEEFEIISDIISSIYNYLDKMFSTICLNSDFKLSPVEDATNLSELLNFLYDLYQELKQPLLTKNFENLTKHNIQLTSMLEEDLNFICQDFGYYIEQFAPSILTTRDVSREYKKIVDKLSEITDVLRANTLQFDNLYLDTYLNELFFEACDGDFSVDNDEEIKTEYQKEKEKWIDELKLT